jgi:hypothetical protein
VQRVVGLLVLVVCVCPVAGCGSSSRQVLTLHRRNLPPIRAIHGHYTVQQVEHAFANMGIKNPKTLTPPGESVVVLDFSRHPLLAAVVVTNPRGAAAFIGSDQRLRHVQQTRRRNVWIFYQPAKSTVAQIALAELQ